jgi:hypothetical protein
MTIKMLDHPEFSDEEVDRLVTDLLVLKKSLIRAFLGRSGLLRKGTKKEIRDRVEEAIQDGTLKPSDLVQFLDEVIPWGKQHVILYKGPHDSIARWKDQSQVATLLKKHRLGKYLNAKLPLALPAELSLSSILHDESRLRVTGIQKREWWERNSEYDESKRSAEGAEVHLRAFVHRVTRGLVAFEWDLTANTSMLQISQLPAGVRYEQVAQDFSNMTRKWLDISRFPVVDVRPAIKKLHELEESGKGETRSHGINYRTLEGRRFEGKSASPADPLLGESVIDTALSAVRNAGIGHLGNFYWLPKPPANLGVTPLESEIHVIVVGADKRINFPTPNEENTIRYVLSRIRSHSP